MRFTCSLLALVLLLHGLNVVAQQSSKLKLDLMPGTASEQILTVSDGAQTAELPVKVIKGKLKGPVFSIVAGIHGYEYPPIIAAEQILSEIEPAKLKGTLIIVPVANMSSFFRRSVFYNPLDGKNLNRVFPGKAVGSISERLADLITKEIIAKSNIFLDIHGGDASEDLTDFVCYYDNKNTPEQTALAKRLAACTAFPFLVVYPFNLTGTLPAEYAFKQATQQAVTALSMEAGKLGNVQQKAVDQIKTGVYNILAELDMYESRRSRISSPMVLDGQHYIKSPSRGIFYSELTSGDKVVHGQKLGNITDVFGKRINQITATRSGIILYKVATPPVNEGETLFCIGFNTDRK